MRERCRYEAQAAIELEQLIEPGTMAPPLEWELHGEERPLRVDVRPMIAELAQLMARGGAKAAELSLRFHCTVVDVVRATCIEIARRTGLRKVVLSGGVWQNEWLLRGAYETLEQAGFDVHVHRVVPANDGGVALGQAAIAGWRAR